MKNNKNKKVVIAVIALAVVLVTVAATYAFITFVLEGEKTNTITGGSLTVKIDESANGDGNIVLDNAFPVADGVGKQSTPYKFTVKNESVKDINYTVSLVSEEVEEGYTKLADNVVKAYLTSTDDTEIVKDVTKLSDLGNYQLATGVIPANSNKSFSLRVWIADTATADDVWDTNESGVKKGKQFSAKIEVVATQVAEYAVSVVNGDEIKSTTVFYNGNAKINVNLSTGTPTLVCKDSSSAVVDSSIDQSTGEITVSNVVDHVTCSITYSE